MNRLSSTLTQAISVTLTPSSATFYRYFTLLTPDDQGHVTFTPVTLTGDWTIRCLLYVPSVDFAEGRVFGNTTNFNSRLFIQDSGGINFRTAQGSEVIAPEGAYTPYFDKLATVVVTKAGDSITITLDHNEVATGTVPATDTLMIDCLNRQSGIFGRSIIADFIAPGVHFALDTEMQNTATLVNRADDSNPGTVHSTSTLISERFTRLPEAITWTNITNSAQLPVTLTVG